MTNYTVFNKMSDKGIVKAWVDNVPVEQDAILQFTRIAQMPFIHKWVAIMPDCHLGKGATVGSVIPTVGAIIPSAAGVDLGCGVSAVLTSLTANDLPDNLLPLRAAIEAAVPHGRTADGRSGDKGAWGDKVPTVVERRWWTLEEGFAAIASKHPEIYKANTISHLGTLGTGNHFIEVCLDEQDRVWFMLHSGSRGVGNKIGSYFIELAKEDMRKWFINLPDVDLAYLPEGTDHFDDYVQAMFWAQEFAQENRNLMMEATIEAARMVLPSFHCIGMGVSCHHNYVTIENHYGKNVYVTRKGAVQARVGTNVIIPGSMGTRSYIGEGLGQPESFNSCSHGAGRRMSRAAARKKFTIEDHAAATAGVECRKDEEVIDETPGAYKDIDAVMKAQEDLVKVKHTLRAVVCVKG